MAFIRLQDNRCINTTQVADLTYTSALEGDQAQPAHLIVSLSNAEKITLKGDDASDLWNELQGSLQQQIPQPDWMLQRLINLANAGLNLNITLQVDGFLVSGYLANGRQFFDGTAEELSAAIQGGEAIKGMFDTIRDQYYPLNDEGTVSSSQHPVFIHLKDARFFNTAGNPIPGNRGVWWRGRVSEVSGFIFGGLSS